MRFDQVYKQEDFLGFLGAFLPEDLVVKEQDIVLNEKRCKAIQRAQILGVCESLDLHVLELEHDKENDPRVTVASDAFKILADHWIHQALVIFKSKNSNNYRLSLLSISLELSEKNKVIKKYSNAKRYSFYLGPNASVNTPNQFLINRGKVSNKEDLISRFSVEIVTKEFFKTYRDTFLDIADEFYRNETFQREVVRKHDVRTSDFVKKMMGRIVFLYFLQRKGWLGVRAGEKWGTGDPHFMRTIFDLCKQQKKNYYNDCLEPLFYDCLGKADRGNNTATNDQSFAPQFNVRIPYLNGGLFEGDYDWKTSNIEIDNKVFDELLSFFDQYNFTVDENTPFDQEVSVDPEMLGKIFENLLVVEDRKSMGAYYTPREIVHYMCRESLVSYLLTESKIPEDRLRRLFNAKDAELFILADEDAATKSKKIVELNDIAEKVDALLGDIKIVDPAVGSGAFLMGMLSEISSIRYYLNNNFLHKLGTYGTPLSLYDIKRTTLESCIYGVDFDPGAVEIAKLRFWLALVVDHEIDEIEALPNLDYKIMQGNSLLEDLVVGNGVISLKFDALQSIDLHSKITQDRLNRARQSKLFPDASGNVLEDIRIMHAQYFQESNPIEKTKLKKLIDSKEIDLVSSKCREERMRLESVIRDSTKEKDKTTAGEEIVKITGMLDRLSTERIKPYFLWHLNFAEVFSEKGGFDVVIANPPYVFAREGDFDKNLKKYIYDKFLHHLTGSQVGRAKQSGKINLYAIFILQSLKLLRNKALLAYIIPNTLLRATTYDVIRKFILDNCKIINITDLPNGVFENVTTSSTLLFLENSRSKREDEVLIQENLPGEDNKTSFIKQESFNRNISYAFNIFSSDATNSIVSKIAAKAQRLDTFVDILAGGIATGPGKQNYISNMPTSPMHKPLIEGKDVKRYKLNFNNKFILYDRAKLYRAREESLFLKKEKLITQRIGGGARPLIVAYDNHQFYTFNSTNSIFLKEGSAISLKYILALLNSNLLNWFYVLQFTNKSNLTVNISKTFLEQLPVIKSDDEDMIVRLVDNILKLTSDDAYQSDIEKQAEVQDLEYRINELVYKSYSLTEEEIKIIQAS